MFLKKVSVYVVGASLMVAAAGCGKKKSSSSSAASGPTDEQVAKLELTSELVLLPAKDSAGGSLWLDGGNTFQVHSSDAEVRKLSLRVNSDAFEAASSVGNILCYFSQTKFWKQVGKGQYQVLVDTDKCEADKGDSGQGQEGSSSSSSSAKNYISAFAESKLEGSDVTAKIRFVMEKDGQTQEYHGDIRVTQQPDDSYPIGLFEMYFAGYNAGKSAGGGHIKVTKADAGKFNIDYMEDSKEGSGTRTTQLMAVLEKSGDNFIGKFNSKGKESGDQGSRTYEYKVNFDKDFAKISGSKVDSFGGGNGGGGSAAIDPTGCYDRNKFVTAIFNYDLASADGTLKELNSGFQIEATIAGKKAQGFAGYGGVGFNDQSLSSKLVNGDTVNKITYANNVRTTSPYTVVKAPGKLTKFTRTATTLGALKKVDMSYYDAGSNYIVQWDGTSFNKVSKVTFGNNGPVEEAASGVVTAPQWGLFLYVQNLNAGIKIPSGTLTDATEIGYHQEEIVSGSANAPGEAMVCYDSCPKIAPTKTELARPQGGGSSCPMVQSNAFKVQSITMNGSTCSVAGAQNLSGTAMGTYTFDASSLNISEAGTAFALPDLSAVSQNESNNYGYRSGALIPASIYAGLSTAVKAKWPGSAEMDLSKFYRWETGASSWSQYTALKDAAGTVATFDKPLDLTYVHSTANDFDGNATYDGKSFRLNYGGPGQLWGIPFKYNSALGYGAPMFAIKPGVAVGDYKIYPTRGDQYMKKAAADTSCAALPVDSVPALPTAVDAKVAGVKVDIGGASPSDSTLELRYIGGEPPVAN